MSDTPKLEITNDHPRLQVELGEYSLGRETSLEEGSLTIDPRGDTPIQHGSIMEFGVYKHYNGYFSDCTFPYSMKAQYVEWGIDESMAKFIEGFVAMLRPKVMLETGTNRGRSTRAILEGLENNREGHLWTVDMQNYGLQNSGALREEQLELVTQVIGELPGAFEAEPLKDLSGIDFAFIDAGHTAQHLHEDLEFVDAHRADECWVLVHDAKSQWWNEIPEYMAKYTKYPVISMRSMTGTDMIWMK